MKKKRRLAARAWPRSATGLSRFAWIAGGLGIGFGALYVVLAASPWASNVVPLRAMLPVAAE